MPHEDRRLAPPRLQVAEIPAIKTDGGDPFCAHGETDRTNARRIYVPPKAAGGV